MTNPWVVLGLVIAIFFFGSSIYSGFDGWVKEITQGPEYCFNDISQSSVAIAAQGVEIAYTKAEGNTLCFRTKDSSIVERLNKQIQDRKLQAQLAEIEAKKQFWNETFPVLFLVGSGVLVFIFIIMIVSSSGGSRY